MPAILTSKKTQCQEKYTSNYPVVLKDDGCIIIPMINKNYSTDTLRRIIRKRSDQLGLSPSNYAIKAGFSESAMGKFLRKENESLGFDKVIKLANYAKMTVTEFLSDGEETNFISISDYIGKNGEVLPLSEEEKKFTKLPISLSREIEAAIVCGNDMFPYFRDGWIIFYSKHHITDIPHVKKYAQVDYNLPDSSDIYSEFFGKPSLVHLKDGRVLLRELKPGSERGRYNLRSYSAPDIENVEIRTAYKIVFIKTDLTNDF